ncbi:hypothetical protein HKCCE4037_01520 [Rhodobacterales bacterium HKCCE4037]|nr:hypothetical protein [Rhodobacterales bacterium HKCCE4037]
MKRVFFGLLAAFAFTTPALATGESAAVPATEPTQLVKPAELTLDTACDPATGLTCDADNAALIAPAEGVPGDKQPPVETQG